MDAADLKVFAAVARIGGMNRAANELHTVQSNVTARVRTLEEELGVQLFRRGRKGVTLTAAGERLLPYAIRVAHLLEEAQKAVKDDGSPRGRLTIGSVETTAALRLSPVLAAYWTTYPNVDLVLRLIKRGVVGIRHIEFGTLEAIYGAVSAGIGVTLLPKSLIGTIWRDRGVAVHEIAEADARITTVFVRRDDALISSALKEFLKLARPTPVRMQAAE
jgi:DNA-binding transcriptional LysR family regulator